MIKLDKKDKRILSCIDMNARMNFAQIAKIVQLSKTVVKYRIDRLEKIGIIDEYYPLINVHKLGFLYIRLWLKFYNITKEKEKEILDFLKKRKKTAWIGLLDGKWDIVIVYLCKTLFEYIDFQTELIARFGDVIKERYNSIATSNSQLKHNFVYDIDEVEEKIMEVTDTPIELPNTDIKILDILKNNCRMSLVNIGLKMKLTANAVKYRLKNLEKEDIILAYCTKINYFKLNYSHFKVFFKFNHISTKEIIKFHSYIRHFKSILHTTSAIGAYDFEVEFAMKDHKEFYDMIKDLRRRFSNLLSEYDYYVVHDVTKIKYTPFS